MKHKLKLIYLVLIITGCSLQSTYFLQIPTSLRNKLKRNEQFWEPQLQLLAVKSLHRKEGLHTGFKYSHFKSLVEKDEKIVSGSLENEDSLDNMKNMHCSCNFKKLFVNTIQEPVTRKDQIKAHKSPIKKIKTKLSKEELIEVKKILKRDIDDALVDSKDVKEIAEKVKNMKEIMKSTKKMRLLLKKEKKLKIKGFKKALEEKKSSEAEQDKKEAKTPAVIEKSDTNSKTEVPVGKTTDPKNMIMASKMLASKPSNVSSVINIGGQYYVPALSPQQTAPSINSPSFVPQQQQQQKVFYYIPSKNVQATPQGYQIPHYQMGYQQPQGMYVMPQSQGMGGYRMQNAQLAGVKMVPVTQMMIPQQQVVNPL